LDIQLEAKDLLKACTIANQIKPKTSQLPLLQQIKITTENNMAVLRYTNLEQIVFLKVNVKTSADGDCLIPIKRTTQFVRYEKGKIKISATDNQVVLSSKNNKSDIDGITVKLYQDKFEDIPEPSIEGIEFDLPTDFQRRIAYALKCVAKEDSRPILTGILFDFDQTNLNMISCDGFWLIHIKTPLNNLTQPFKIVIPANALQLVSRHMNGIIKFGYNKDKAWFKTKDLTIVTQLIQGTYPAWQQLIPATESTWTINLSAPLLCQRLNQIALNNNPDTIKMLQKDGMLLLQNKIEELEETEIFISATMNGDGKIAFDRRYLLEASKVFSTMDIKTITPSSPITVTGDLEGVTFVIMPQVVQW
jgi:DNA polymerase-3 subunit beta